METCCVIDERVNYSNAAAHEREVPLRAFEGWKLVWADPGPYVKIINSVVSGPFETPKILKALPYKVVSKCESCTLQNRRRLQNGIPDPWLEYLEDVRKEGQEDVKDSKEKDVELVKKDIKITDYVWNKKGLALLQGIPDPWKPDLPCKCVIKQSSKNKIKNSHDRKFKHRSSTNERESPRRRSSAIEEETPRKSSNEEEIPKRKSLKEEEIPRRKSLNEEESSARRDVSGNEEEPLEHQNVKREEKSPNRRSKIEKNTKRRNKKYPKELEKRQNKSEKKTVENVMCCTLEPFKMACVCYGGIVPPCLKDYFVEVHPKRRSKHLEGKYTKSRAKKNDEELVRKSTKKGDEEEPVKRRSKKRNEEPNRRSISCQDTNKDCLKMFVPTSRNKKKEQTSRLSDTTSEDSSELSAEALSKPKKRSDASKHKVDEVKTPRSLKKSRIYGSGFDKVKQRLQELENELKAKEAAKDLKLREMEQLSKLKKKSRKRKERSVKAREKFGKQKGTGRSDYSDECTNKRSTWKEPTPRANYCLKADEYLIQSDRNETKNVSRWLDEPGTLTKKLSKESSKSSKKTEPPRATSRNTRELKTPSKSVRNGTRPVTARPCSPQAATSTCLLPRRPPSSTNRRVSYTDEPQPTCRTCSPCAPSYRRVSYSDEAQPPAPRASTPSCRRHPASCDDDPVTPRSNLSKTPRCPSITSAPSPKDSKESMKKFLDEINNRIEITRDALNSPEMKSVAVQPFQEEATPWRCPGRLLCPRMRERAGGDLFVRRIRVGAATDGNEDGDAEALSKLPEESVEDFKDSDASDCIAGADRPYLQPSYRRCSMADFKRRQKEIEEIFVESLSERD